MGISFESRICRKRRAGNFSRPAVELGYSTSCRQRRNLALTRKTGGTMKNFARRAALACVLACLSAGAAADKCDPDETKVGEDRHFLYCMKTRDIDACRTKGGEVGKCVNAGCVRAAGFLLKDTVAECKEKNEMCLHERGAPVALIAGVSACIAGVATANLATCFASGVASTAAYDSVVAVCKVEFGKCVQPGLDEHKGFVQACERYRK
jgi:hypothetical protein